MQHIRGRAHLDAVKKIDKCSSSASSTSSMSDSYSTTNEGFGLRFIADMQADKIDSNTIHQDKNRYKAMKKHVKKLLQKLMDSGLEFEKKEEEARQSKKQWGDPNLKAKTRKHILELERLVGLFSSDKGTAVLSTQMDRLMADIRKASVKVREHFQIPI
jgi:hypothetical protein